MYRSATIVSLFLTSLLAAPLVRADAVTTYGAGLRSCRAYVEVRDGDIPGEVVFIDWLSGYFSGVNRTSNHRNNLLGLADLGWALKRLDALCQARPDLHFAEAAGIMLLGAKPGPATHALEVTTYGSADKACRVFVEAREQQEMDYWAEFMRWLGGYLSGVNAMSLRTSNVLGDVQLAEALRWLDVYCGAHPDTRFGPAVEALVAQAAHRSQSAAMIPPP